MSKKMKDMVLINEDGCEIEVNDIIKKARRKQERARTRINIMYRKTIELNKKLCDLAIDFESALDDLEECADDILLLTGERGEGELKEASDD